MKMKFIVVIDLVTNFGLTISLLLLRFFAGPRARRPRCRVASSPCSVLGVRCPRACLLPPERAVHSSRYARERKQHAARAASEATNEQARSKQAPDRKHRAPSNEQQ